MSGSAFADSIKPAYTITPEQLQSHGINPVFLVAAHLSDGGKRLVLAEHRPGKQSVLHVFDEQGGFKFSMQVPSPQLVDFYVEGDGQSAFLVGSLGTRFYNANLQTKNAQLIMSSQPDRPGFRALTPVTIVPSAEGPAVYGLFYEDEKRSRDLGFARIDENGEAKSLLTTTSWEDSFGQVLSFSPHPDFKGALVVHQERKKDPKAYVSRQLSYAAKGAKPRLLDFGDDIFGTTWLPDGGAAIYVKKKGDGASLMMRILSSAEPVTLAQGRYFAPRMLAKRRLVVSKLDDRQKQEVWLMTVPAGEPQQLDVPGPTAFYSADPTGTALAAWGGWGVSAFRF
ncbi:MAG: hypothetical protein HY925_01205 [Elusimicrobia bacterium]|nr:hypothetical protein [Elusimicrobiota bacterium]